MFTSLSYKDYKIISYPTEIFNEKYKRSKIEFNYCLVLKNSEFEENDIFSLKKAKESQEEEQSESDNEGSDFEDHILRLGEDTSIYSESTKKGEEEEAVAEISKINERNQLQSQNLKNLTKKISKFLTDIEVGFSLLTDEEQRVPLFDLLDELFRVINSRKKSSLFFKSIMFCFQFYTKKRPMKYLKHYFEVKELKRPLLVKKFCKEDLMQFYEKDYLAWLVLENLDLRCSSCNHLVQKIWEEKFLMNSKKFLILT